MTNLTDPIFTDEDAARAHFEALRWPDGRVCPHCGTINNSTLMQGKTTRPGLYKCKDCRKPFTATMGTVYERSHIPLHKWLLATHLLVSSKKGMSSHQLFRMLGFGSYRTAWFMAHRIREAMRDGDLAPFGSGGGSVEIDETFIGIEPTAKDFTPVRSGFHHKMKVLALVDRDSGRSKAFVIDYVAADVVKPIIRENLAREARILTDESPIYRRLRTEFAGHSTVNHKAGEYVSRLTPDVHTNTIEGYFSIFKRGMRGVYQHCAKKHLHRYLAEFDFRYSNRIATGADDTERAARAVAGVVGKRLTYQQPHQRAH